MVSSGFAKTFCCDCTGQGECGTGLSICTAREGFGKEVFDRVIVVEFGGETAAFDAFHQGYVIEGRYVPISKLGPEHTWRKTELAIPDSPKPYGSNPNTATLLAVPR